ncbi:MAG TPA: hypothetical protein VF189_04090 [Patescibacteria group bacterium]
MTREFLSRNLSRLKDPENISTLAGTIVGTAANGVASHGDITKGPEAFLNLTKITLQAGQTTLELFKSDGVSLSTLMDNIQHQFINHFSLMQYSTALAAFCSVMLFITPATIKFAVDMYRKNR